MIDVTVNPKSVYVPMIHSKFFKFKFDSTYPTQLNGIISDDEFQQSINRINRKISSNKSILLIGIVLGIGIIIGIILCIVGGITAVLSSNFGFPPTIGVGISFFIFGPIFFCIGCYIVQSQRKVRMRQIIAEESMKYSSRSPISCSWRLENSRHPVGEYGHYDPNHLVDHLVIDIGHSISANQVIPEQTIIVE